MSLPNRKLSLIFEYASKGNLHDYLKSSSLTWQEKSKLSNEILLGLEYCHDKHIFHLNLKLSNILIMEDGTIKLMDFKVNNNKGDNKSDVENGVERDSLYWFSPERICKDEKMRMCFEEKSHLSDIYSCGLILWSVACNGMIPYENMDEEEIEKEKSNINTIQGLVEKISKDCPGDYLETINNLTKYNPEERYSLSTAIAKLQSILQEEKMSDSDQIVGDSQITYDTFPQNSTKLQQEQIRRELQRSGIIKMNSEQKNIEQPPVKKDKIDEETSNQPRNSISSPDLKHFVVKSLSEQDKKERRHSSAEVVENNAKSFRRSGVGFQENPILINPRASCSTNISFYYQPSQLPSPLSNSCYRNTLASNLSTKFTSPLSHYSSISSLNNLNHNRVVDTPSINSQFSFIEELFEFYQSQIRIDLISFPKQFQYWLKSKQLNPTSIFELVKNIPSQKNYESLLGMLYENGIGTLQNKILAFHCYTMGKDNNDPISKALLANAHFIGCGTKKNIKQAFALWKKYANEGNIWCQFMLAEYYYNSTISVHCFGKTDLLFKDGSKEAFTWYMKSAQGGYISAEYKVGCCYKKGFGAIKSSLAAFQWYLKAAINGFMIAQYKVAKCYQKEIDGYGKYNEKKDENEAFKWYIKSASNRYEKAMKIVAEEYENGFHVDKDLVEARKWYELAFLLDLDWACAKLKQWCKQDIIKNNDPLYYEVMSEF
ncbi:14030_t:CDS:2 [Funneliformis caledonium]|uniref:14030_t:CDS:1 n=1 Tax=Funneliformis caledonium TaxID=1117310 RepID=A0A9N9F497_9GLOM|nr:14030_t:CDS:2 [Funneliformis caledonium]